MNILHRHRKVLNIVFFFFFFFLGGGGGGGGKVQNIGWGGGAMGAKLFAGCKMIGAPAPNQCQIITFLILKTDDIAKLRTELKKYTFRNTF